MLRSSKQHGLAPRAVISAEVRILGCLQTDGEVEIEGRIEGDIRCSHLTVAKSGVVIGDITAEDVVVRGRVKGVIRASRVLVQHGAHVESEICHAKLSIDEGSYFKGTSAPNDTAAMPVALTVPLCLLNQPFSSASSIGASMILSLIHI